MQNKDILIQKLEELVTSEPTHNEKLKEILQVEWKQSHVKHENAWRHEEQRQR